jgi:ribosomal protein S18 acetylase RimI-like enzyme
MEHDGEGWLIRRMQLADRSVVGQVLAEAFADIYAPVVGHDAAFGAELAAIFPPELTCYVGERAGEICGAAFLTFSVLQGTVGLAEERALWRVLRTHQSVGRALLSRILLSLPATAPRADRLTSYVSSFAVRPAWQGQGLGSALLRHLEAASRDAGKTRIALHVTDTNWKARRLYERHGFQALRLEPSLFTQRIWGFRGLIYMIKYLPEVPLDNAL